MAIGNRPTHRFDLNDNDFQHVLTQWGGGVEVIRSLLPFLAEGVQLWSSAGEILYANPESFSHFDLSGAETNLSYTHLLSQCFDESGLPLSNAHFPISHVMETGGPAQRLTVKIPGKVTRWLELGAYPVTQADGRKVGMLSTSYNVTELIEKSRDLERHAHYDALTGLPNRMILSDRLAVAMSQARRRNELLAVCLMDLDGFKFVNDTLGHEAGDVLLQEIARRLRQTLRSEDTAARLGGDEFVLLVGGLHSETEYEIVLQRLLDVVAAPVMIHEKQARVTASLGVTLYPNDNVVADLLLRHADQAMYRAKEGGKNAYHLFDSTFASRLKANQSAKDRIAKALKKNQFELYYQPQVDCLEGKVVGAEALIRWNHPILGVRPPAEFLPLIEKDDLIIDIGNWVIAQALNELQVWQNHGLSLSMGVNISARHLLRGKFKEYLDSFLASPLAALTQHLEIEILETAALEDIKMIGSLISQYKTRGIAFALDDFGTGFSSLSHLKHLCVSTLKIDQGFVRDMLHDPGDQAIVKGILGLSNAFKSKVIAEGVETIEQILLLLKMGCTLMQGYAIARPMRADKFPGWVTDFNKNPLWNSARDRYPSRQDFELLMIEVIQQNWFSQVKNYIASNQTSKRPGNYEESRLAQWYRGNGLMLFGAQPAFHELDNVHRRVHRLAEQALIAATQNGSSGAEDILTELSKENAHLLRILQRFRSTVSC